MKPPTLQGKLLSPAGFGLVLLCFFLPFVAVSCGPADNQLTATFTGLSMVSNGRPTITGTDLNSDDIATIHALIESQYDLEPLALFAALVIMAAMVCAVIKRVRTRHLVGLTLAIVALGLLVGAVLRAQSRLENMRGTNLIGVDAIPDAGVATTRYGFWLAAAGLVVLAVGHGLALTKAPKEPPVAESPPPEAVADVEESMFFGDDPGPPQRV